jgi:hypothetical protein
MIRTQDRPGGRKSDEFELLGSDDASYGHARWKDAGAFEVHGFGGHIGVLEGGAI